MIVEFSSEKKYSVGIIPHFLDKDEEIFEKMLKINPNDETSRKLLDSLGENKNE